MRPEPLLSGDRDTQRAPTLLRLLARSAALMRATSGVPWVLARIQLGLRSGSVVASILIGMRAIFSAPRSLTPLVTGVGEAAGAGTGADATAEVGSDMRLFYAFVRDPADAPLKRSVQVF